MRRKPLYGLLRLSETTVAYRSAPLRAFRAVSGGGSPPVARLTCVGAQQVQTPHERPTETGVSGYPVGRVGW